MKEERFFYVPDAASQTEMPMDEAMHALRVLRLKSGDEMYLMDGVGNFYRAEVTIAATKRCLYEIHEQIPQTKNWHGRIHIAMAPTKMMDRVEWFAEKATEIGFDELTFLDCQFSERRVVKKERIEKILVSAMKQSHKAWMPQLNEMASFENFVTTPRPGNCFICHCYEQGDVSGQTEKPFLLDVLKEGMPATVLIGPEGDFSIDEVRLAEAKGYRSVSLGRSRLRTETAALVAVHLMQLKNSSI